MGLLIAGLIVIGVIAVVGGGNTVEGFGKDVKHTGTKIESSTD